MSAPALVPAQGRLEHDRHLLPVRVYYEDTDFTGVVYHAAYLRFFERGRTEFLRALGVDHRALLEREDPCAFAVTRLSVDFRRAARVDDALVVHTRFRQGRGVRLAAEQAIERDGAPKPAIVAEAQVEVVCIRPDGRPRRPPADLVAALAPLTSAAEAP